jgi:hypothetical protein
MNLQRKFDRGGWGGRVPQEAVGCDIGDLVRDVGNGDVSTHRAAASDRVYTTLLAAGVDDGGGAGNADPHSASISSVSQQDDCGRCGRHFLVLQVTLA